MLSLFKDFARPLYKFLFHKNYRAYYSLTKHINETRNQTKTIKFLNYKINVADSPSFVYQFKEIFVEESYKFKSKTEHPIIIDCGANIGLSCLYFKQLFPNCKIFAFEADPEIFKLLQSNIICNHEQGVTLFNKAVWVHDSGVDFAPDGADGGSVVITGARSIHIESIRLKEFLKNHKVELLKIDIEGAEVDVLLDCDNGLSDVENIFFEYHSFKSSLQRLDQVLKVVKENGFKYIIQSPNNVNAPFIPRSNSTPFDLQLNVYCYRT